MNYRSDTICAISTPIGTGGISVIRLSGPKAFEYTDKIFQGNKALKDLDSHRVIYGKIKDNSETIDEVYVSLFKKPRSYTGEDVVEISCHGNTFIANRILELLLLQARLAEPGEFTQRAFLNNRIDLTQAEAVGDLLQARTKKSHKAAIEQLQGSLHNKIDGLLKKLTTLRTLLELEIDFLEQDLEDTDKNKMLEELIDLKSDLRKLADTGEEGLILKDGFMVSLVGAPNVGKSSIFNSFLETERAHIVSLL